MAEPVSAQSASEKQSPPSAEDCGQYAPWPSADELIGAWCKGVSGEDEAQTIGLFGGRAPEAQGLSRGSKAARIREMLAIVRRYDIFHGLTPKSLRHMLEELGPTFVKAGQILSMRSEILPQSFCRELGKLRTEVEPMDRETVLQALREEYDRSIEEIFDAIDDKPLGSASVAQVHKGRLVTGELVAIKVQRPHVQETMAQDISIMRSLARYANRFMGDEQFIDLTSVVDELWQSFREETDFLVEARALAEFRHNNADVRYIDCPKPYPALCTKHVVVMDYVEGIPIDDHAALVEAGYDLAEIAEKLVDNYATQMLDDGFFHADPHPGNLFVHGGKIVYLDLGIMGRLSSHDRQALADMVEAVAAGDSAGLADGLKRFAVSETGDIDHAHLLADLDQIIANYGLADLSDLDIGAFLNSLVSMAQKNGIELPGTVTMLARSLVTLEGVVDGMLPNASIVDIIKGHLRAHAHPGDLARAEAKRLGVESVAAVHGLLGAAGQAELALKMLTRGQLRMNLDMAGTEDPLEDLAHIVDRLTMSIFVAGLFIGSSVVYYARIQPVIFGIPIIGFVGYVIALFLGLWVAFDIFRESRRRRR